MVDLAPAQNQMLAKYDADLQTLFGQGQAADGPVIELRAKQQRIVQGYITGTPLEGKELDIRESAPGDYQIRDRVKTTDFTLTLTPEENKVLAKYQGDVGPHLAELEKISRQYLDLRNKTDGMIEAFAADTALAGKKLQVKLVADGQYQLKEAPAPQPESQVAAPEQQP